MAEEKHLRQIKVKKKKKKLGFNWFFWISFVIILIPCVYFVNLLLQASKVSNVPITGERINNSITYYISEADLDYVKTDIKALDNVENSEVNLIVETLRITIDAKDGLTKEEYQNLSVAVYSIVDKYLPVSRYFTREGDYKQYDLEINLYDNLEAENATIMVLFKNGSMDNYELKVLSEPLNEELAYNLTHPNEKKDDEPDDSEEETYLNDD